MTLTEQLLAIHYPVKYYPAPDNPVTECAECGRHWPCKTKRLIDKANEASNSIQ